MSGDKIMATNYALRVNAPHKSEGGSISVGSVASTAGSGNLAGAVCVWCKSTVDTRLVFGAAGVAAPTAADIYLTAGTDYVFDLLPTDVRVRVIRVSSNGTFYWRPAA